ncbi:hypothetical protein I308_100593 [Cryptococcus tetragattii IND107]|uniref:Uncharacterized protein n=1 Tax=Cryptococcus tetragattii IND107 TaxID=1296105 RepID=A0ABR3C7R3_9TREE
MFIIFCPSYHRSSPPPLSFFSFSSLAATLRCKSILELLHHIHLFDFGLPTPNFARAVCLASPARYTLYLLLQAASRLWAFDLPPRFSPLALYTVLYILQIICLSPSVPAAIAYQVPAVIAYVFCDQTVHRLLSRILRPSQTPPASTSRLISTSSTRNNSTIYSKEEHSICQEESFTHIALIDRCKKLKPLSSELNIHTPSFDRAPVVPDLHFLSFSATSLQRHPGSGNLSIQQGEAGLALVNILMMSEACVLPTHLPPSSPDPTHLRLLAFSVAEAALQSDPNSPSFSLTTDKAPILPEFSRRLCNWPIRVEGVEEDWKKNRWRGTEYVNRAQWKMGHKKMGMKKSSLGKIVSESPSISPSSYNLNLPRNSSLAAITSDYDWNDPYERPAIASEKQTKGIRRQRLWSCTRFVSPSSTSPQLDQARPPPDFELSLAAKKCTTRPEHGPDNNNAIAKSDVFLPNQPIDYPPCTNLANKTPTDEYTSSRIEARLALSTVLSRRPSTPPSPIAMSIASSPKEKEAPRLAPFLRERTNGRISRRPSSMPPMTSPAEHMTLLAALEKNNYTPPKPAVMVTPPKNRYKFEGRGDVPEPIRPPLIQSLSGNTKTSGIGGSSFQHMTSTPSSDWTAASPTYITSPTGSASSTMSIPRIICTPAPVKIVKDGLEMDSDEEGDVVLFEADTCGSEPGRPSFLQATQEKERVARAAAMKKRLLQRRMSN